MKCNKNLILLILFILFAKIIMAQIKGSAYWYWLESISISGEKHTYGPICIYILAYSQNCQHNQHKPQILSDTNNKTNKPQNRRML